MEEAKRKTDQASDKAQADAEELEAQKRKQAELEAYRQRPWYKKLMD